MGGTSVRKCEVCGVRRVKNKKSTSDVFLARFPLEPERCRLWVKLTGNEDLAYLPLQRLNENKFICGNHFESSAFNQNGSRLKRNAIPTINLNVPLSDEILSSFPIIPEFEKSEKRVSAGGDSGIKRKLEVKDDHSKYSKRDNCMPLSSQKISTYKIENITPVVTETLDSCDYTSCSDTEGMDSPASVPPLETESQKRKKSCKSEHKCNNNLALEDLSINQLNTTVKAPAVSKSSQNHVNFLNSIQRFGSSDWDDKHYLEVQKRYCSTPGFIDTKCNIELKAYDTGNSLSITEKGLAAITQALIKQKESMQSGLETLLSWVSLRNDITVPLMKNKLKEIFTDGSYNKISDDLLQMVCGHRADLIRRRRDGVLRHVNDEFTRASLSKVPPTCDLLFDNVTLSAELEKNGGVAKTFCNASSEPNRPAAVQATSRPSHAKPLAQRINQCPKGNFGRRMSNQPTQGTSIQPLREVPRQPLITRQIETSNKVTKLISVKLVTDPDLMSTRTVKVEKNMKTC